MEKKIYLYSIAHRGYAVKEVENTLNAFIEAGKRNFVGIETDIYFTNDGYIICHHDPRLKGMDKDIVDCSFNELRSVTLRNGNAQAVVPLFKEYLNVCRDYKKIPVIEFKTNLSDLQIDIVIDTVKKEYGDINECFFISFHRSPLLKMKEQAKLNNYKYKLLRLGGNLDEAKEALKDNIGLDFEYHNLTINIIKMFKKKNLDVVAWTVDNRDDAEDLTLMGVNYITSNILECEDSSY